MKGLEKISEANRNLKKIEANRNPKKAEVVILISDKIDIKSKT